MKLTQQQFNKKLQQSVEQMLGDNKCLLMIQVELFLLEQTHLCNKQTLEVFAKHLTSYIDTDSAQQHYSYVLYQQHGNSYQITTLGNQQRYPNMANHSSSHITEFTKHIKQARAISLGCEINALFEKIKYPINAISIIRNKRQSDPSAFSN